MDELIQIDFCTLLPWLVLLTQKVASYTDSELSFLPQCVSGTLSFFFFINNFYFVRLITIQYIPSF